MAIHSSTLAWKIPWTEEPGWLQSMGSLRVGHDWATSLSCIGEGNGNPLQWYCLENPRDRGAWWALSLGSHRVRHDWSDLAAAACLFNWWCHPTISSSAAPFSSCPQSFPASESFPQSQLFTSGGQIIGVSASTSVLPMNTQDWSPLAWTGWISLQSKGLSRVFSNTTVQKHQTLTLGFRYSPTVTSIHDYWKNHRFPSIRVFSNETVFPIRWPKYWSSSFSISISSSNE